MNEQRISLRGRMMLVLFVLFLVFPGMLFQTSGKAESGQETIKKVTGLGTVSIKNPEVPLLEDDEWKGSYVYFGKYGSNGTLKPVKYRVLDKESGDFGVNGGSLLLDCDTMLFESQFNSTRNVNRWSDSLIKQALNDGENSFLNKPGHFTAMEKAAIAESVKSGPSDGDGKEAPSHYGFAPLTGEKIFLLDVGEVSRKSYGYLIDTGESFARIKAEDGYWWLRSPWTLEYHGQMDNFASFVLNTWEIVDLEIFDEGEVSSGYTDHNYGVSPAFNVRLSSVVYSSLDPSSSVPAGEPGAEYKLTVLDSGMQVSVDTTIRDHDQVYIFYDVQDNSSNANPSQVSVVVTKDPWVTPQGTLNQHAELLQYEVLTDPISTGKGDFVLDTRTAYGTWGTDFHVYVLAEEVNGSHESDYAGMPVEISSPIILSHHNYQGNYDGLGHGATVETSPANALQIKYKKHGEEGNYQDTPPTYKDAAELPYLIDVQINTKSGKFLLDDIVVVEIDKAPLTVKANDLTITYGDAPAENGVTYTGFVHGETEAVLQGNLAYDFDYHQYDNIGSSFKITPGGLTSNNYEIGFEHGTLKVLPKEITVSGIKANDKTYDGTHLVEFDYSEMILAGRVNEDDVSVWAEGAFLDVNAGQNKEVNISIISLEGSKSGNYELNRTTSQFKTTASIWKADPTVIPPVVIRSLSYTGEPQELVNPGFTLDGTLKYAVNDTTPDASAFVESVPTGKNSGIYTVWYKVIGDANHNDSNAESVTVTIVKARLEDPIILPKPYTGERQTAEVPLSSLYTVIKNEGGIEVGLYDVVLRLTDSSNYRWLNSKGTDLTLKFEIGRVLVPVAIPVTYNPNQTLRYVELRCATGWDWQWVNPDLVPIVNNHGYDVKLEVMDGTTHNLDGAEGYDPLTHTLTRTILVTVYKATPTFSAPAAAEGLSYTGKPQKLVIPGTTHGGTMKYAATQSYTPPQDAAYTTAVPEGVDAGAWFVWYKVVGDENYNDAGPYGPISVSIDKAENPATVIDTVEIVRSGNQVDLAKNVRLNGATGKVRYKITGGAKGCSIIGSRLISGNDIGVVTVKVTIDEDANHKAVEKSITVNVVDKYIQLITAEDVTLTYGDKGGHVTARSDGDGEIRYAVREADRAIIDVDASSGEVTIRKAGTANVIVTASETATYQPAMKEVKVTICKARAIPAVVAANTSIYDGTAKQLVSVAGEAVGGNMVYAVVTAADRVPDAAAYTASIPTASELGTYYVWFKVDGDMNHTDTEPQRVVAAITEMKSVYTCVSGDRGTWQKESGVVLSFRFKNSVNDVETYNRFTGIEVDGKAVAADKYWKRRGSVQIDLKPTYLETLSVGEHKLNAVFEDGNVETIFEIIRANIHVDTLPSTGDAQHPLLYGVGALIGLIGLCWYLSQARTNQNQS